MCGFVFRLKDANNYYIARANALEGNVRIYRVVEGKRTEFGSWKGEVPRGVWQELAVEAKGNDFQVIYNGNQIIKASDESTSSVSTAERLKELVLFSVSSQYFGMRQQLGIAGAQVVPHALENEAGAGGTLGACLRIKQRRFGLKPGGQHVQFKPGRVFQVPGQHHRFDE